jgi:hypothetical protein
LYSQRGGGSASAGEGATVLCGQRLNRLATLDAVAGTLDPTMDLMALLEAESVDVMFTEVGRRLQPNRLFCVPAHALDPLTRMPRQLGHVLSELEQGSLKLGIVPMGLDELRASLHSVANRVGAPWQTGARSCVMRRVTLFGRDSLCGVMVMLAASFALAVLAMTLLLGRHGRLR